MTLSNDKVTFPLNRAEVSDDAKALIDEAIAQLKAENKGVFFEIEGHTDSTGPDAYNMKLGEDRAMAVRDYLHDQHGIALSRMEVISYGEAKPVAGQQDPGQPRPEPPRRHQGPGVETLSGVRPGGGRTHLRGPEYARRPAGIPA